MNGRSREQLWSEVNALYDLVKRTMGPEKMIVKAGKVGALKLMRANSLPEKVLALYKIVSDTPAYDELPSEENIKFFIDKISENLAQMIARKTIEKEIERRVNEKIDKNQREYLLAIKKEILREKMGTENAQTLKKLALLEKMERNRLTRSILEILRPDKLEDIVGQEKAWRSLVAKLASPCPPHVILYGPPGVGKTTTARLALEAAKRAKNSVFKADAPFIEVNGATLRWDPRESTNPLIGSVHDPIYQGARRDLAEGSIPEPKLGLVSEAHGGVLFIDEIGEMDSSLITKMLKVMEDKRVYFESSYYDPHDPSIPQYIKHLFEKGAPADFVLIGATTCRPEELNPALRSRCVEVFFAPLTKEAIKEIILRAASKINLTLSPEAIELIASTTSEGRKAINILADVYAEACYRWSDPHKKIIDAEIVREVLNINRLYPVIKKAYASREVGRVLGMGVSGFRGVLLEIEAIIFPAREPGRGSIRFNDTAGTMAKDALFNAAAVIRCKCNLDLSDYDVHVNIAGGARVDGPSAGAALFLVIYSCLTNRPIPQNLAVTGEISVRGTVKPVGAVEEKIFGARYAGVEKIIIPYDNYQILPLSTKKDIDIMPVKNVDELIKYVFS